MVSASLELDFSLPLFTAPLVPTLILTGAARPPTGWRGAEKAGAQVVIAGEGRPWTRHGCPRLLAELGLHRLLTEGGPRLLGQFVAAGVLDELCLTSPPVLAAGTRRGSRAGPSVPGPRRFALESVLEEEGFLFTRYRRLRTSRAE